MFGSEALAVAIGLILVYLLLSLICSALREGLEGWLKTRSMHLERGIRELLNDKDGTRQLARAVYMHPMVQGLYRDTYDDAKKKAEKQWIVRGNNLPSYIPASNFAMALMDIVARGKAVDDAQAATAAAPWISLDSLRASVSTLGNPEVQRALLTAIDTANGDLARAQANIEAWFNSAMDRVSGWYRRRTQLVLFVLGLLLTIAVNANTLTLVDVLSKDEALREVLAERAAMLSKEAQLPAAEMDKRMDELKALRLPLGWEQGILGPRPAPVPKTGPDGQPESGLAWAATWAWTYVLHPLLGWLLTAVALSFGAPFWFDVLNKAVVIRSTVKPHEKSPEEASEDRQKPAAPPAPRPPESPPLASAGAAPSMVEPFQPHEWASGNPQEGVL